MHRALTAVVFITGLAWTSAGMAVDSDEPPGDPDLGHNIISAAAFDGRLWVLGETGRAGDQTHTLVSFALADGARKVELTGVIGLQKQSGHFWVFAATQRPHRFRLLEWRHGAFATLSDFDLGWRLKPLTLTAIGDHPAIVTSRAVRWFDGGAWHNTSFDSATNDTEWGFASAGAPSAGRYLYLGYNRGEWGGGLKRIDLATGAVADIEDTDKSSDGFGTILTSGLDPVNAIIADPGRPDCVVAAVGLVHMASSGRLLRICGGDVSVVLDKVTKVTDNGRDFDVNEAFFGLVPAAGGYWAISNGAVYRFTGTQNPQRLEITEVADWHGLALSRALPGLLVLYTGLNQHFSLSGYTPLIIPLD